MKANSLANLEPLLEDWRVERSASRVIEAMAPADTSDWDFVTFVVPKREITRKTPEGIVYPQTIPAKAVYAIVSPNPRPMAKRFNQKLMTHATVDLAAFMEREFRGDTPDYETFLRLAREHLQYVTNLRDMIN